jgi:hypothetical protein
LSSLSEQYMKSNSVTYGMILFNILIGLYLLDALIFEEGMILM